MPDRDTRMSWRDDKPTYKQLNFIKELEDEYGEEFTGTTKGEAADYISKWKKYDDERRRQDCIENEAVICKTPSAVIISSTIEHLLERSPLTGLDIPVSITELKIICGECGTELNVKGAEDLVVAWAKKNNV